MSIGRRAARKARAMDDLYDDEEAAFLRACLAYQQRHKLRCLHATDYLRILVEEMGYENRRAGDEPGGAKKK